MRKTILNITLAGALGLAGFGATPASAGDNEALGQFLFGAVALAILGKAINDRNDRKQNPAVVQAPNHPPRQQATKARKVLPAACVRRHATTQGRVRMVAQRCLQQNNVRVNRLPDQCFERVRNTQGQVRRGFLVRCMKRRGYAFQ